MISMISQKSIPILSNTDENVAYHIDGTSSAHIRIYYNNSSSNSLVLKVSSDSITYTPVSVSKISFRHGRLLVSRQLYREQSSH